MIQRYTYVESIIKDSNSQWNDISLEKNNSSLLRIFRLLSGTTKLKDNFNNDKNYIFKTNYFKMPFEDNTHSQKSIINTFEEEISLNQLSSYFKYARHNNKFYKNIEPEIINCLVARHEGRYLESFLFLYRILEGISYSIPLIYTSKSNDFLKSFKTLQKFISKDSTDGELNFFKKFIKETYKDRDFFKTTVDINFSDIEIEELKKKYFQIYKNKIKNPANIKDETQDEEIKLSFIGFYEFMIELRNRYFHFLQGAWNDNIGTASIIHPDLFFKPIIDLGINWVAIIFFEILYFDFENIEN
jgi:hypothetical protein